MLRNRICFALGLAAILVPAIGRAQTELDTLMASPDTHVVLGGALIADHQLVVDDLEGMVAVMDLGSLPADAAVDALHRVDDQVTYFSLATGADLGGVPFSAADVIAYDSAGGTYSLIFDAAASGVPAGADLDALSVGENGELVMSFDVTSDIGGIVLADEDLVSWDGSSFSLAFDGSAAGLPVDLDLDALHRLPTGHLLLSFDGFGSVSGISFADEDLLEVDQAGASWWLAYDGSAELPGWEAADLDAVSVGLPPSVLEIPTLGTWGAALLAALLALMGFRVLSRTSTTRRPAGA